MIQHTLHLFSIVSLLLRTHSWPWQAIENVSIHHSLSHSLNTPFVVRELDASRIFASGKFWEVSRLLRECASSYIFVGQRLLPGVEMLLKTWQGLEDALNAALQQQHAIDLAQVRSLYHHNWTLSQYIEYAYQSFGENRSRCALQNDCYKIVNDLNVASIADFVSSYLLPVSIHDLEQPENVCLALGDDLKPHLHSQASRQTRFFVTPAHSRSYPAHDHGTVGDTHVLGVILDGTKTTVAWEPAEAPKLYPFHGVGTEMKFQKGQAARLFMAEGIHPDVTLQPRVRDTKTLHGSLQSGDLFFMPRRYIHQLENQGSLPAVQLVWLPATKADVYEILRVLSSIEHASPEL